MRYRMGKSSAPEKDGLTEGSTKRSLSWDEVSKMTERGLLNAAFGVGTGVPQKPPVVMATPAGPRVVQPHDWELWYRVTHKDMYRLCQLVAAVKDSTALTFRDLSASNLPIEAAIEALEKFIRTEMIHQNDFPGRH